jgi:CheY-like chemotaxis protein/HPt (histidine-containing phosphotransfer) domain-containing protein
MVQVDSSSAEQATDLSDLAGLRVLIADRHSTTRDILARRLAEWGAAAEVVHENDRVLALLDQAAAEAQPFRLILLAEDGANPGSQELAKSIRAGNALGNIALFMLVRTDSDLDTATLNQAGFNGRLTKPVRQEDLLHALHFAVHARPAGAESQLPRARPSRNARILLAEDNDINQLIVKELLADEGFACDIAPDGLAAVDAASRTHYDVILMDCQMPRMDGFEAAERIRQREQAIPSASGPVPIIALTANAVSGDRQRCMDSGMSAYCTKPIKPKQLIEMIESFLPKPAAPSEDSPVNQSQPASKPQAAVPAPPPLDYPTLVTRCSGKAALADRVLERLLVQMSESVQKLQASLDQGQAEEFARAAHALKGAAGMASALGVSGAAAQLETLGRAGGLSSQAERGLTALRDEVRRCEQFIRAQAGSRAAPTAQPQTKVRE